MQRVLAGLLAVLFVSIGIGLAPPLPAQVVGTPEAGDFGSLYRHWQQSQNAEDRIGLGERLLALEPTLTTWPIDAPRPGVRAEIQFELGNAYVGRQTGTRAENLEQAIAHLDAVLAIWTRETNAQSWARTHNNLGIAYWARVQGELADNQEKAIAHFEAAATVFTRETAPHEWAQLQNNLAIANISRIRGTRTTNLETAIAHFEAGLTVFTREAMPLLWAQIQNNLAAAYGRRVEGVRAENRDKAIAHLEAALTVLTRETSPVEWATGQSNLASAYLDRDRGEPADNEEKALAHIGAALQVFTQDAFPQQWAKTQFLAGNAYSNRIRGDRTSNQHKAMAAYDDALDVFTRDADPRNHMLTAQRLAHVLLETGEWELAGVVHASARDAFLLLFGEGLEEAEARALIAAAGPLFADAAFGAVQRGEMETAFELASEGRARLMAVSLKLQALSLPAAERARLEMLRAAIRAAHQAADAAQGTDRAAAIEKLSVLRQELLDLVKQSGTTNSDARPALSRARQLVDGNTVVVLPVVTKLGGKVLLMTKSLTGIDLTMIDLPQLSTDQLARLLIGPSDGPPAGWLGAYFINYLSGAGQDQRWPEWLGAIDALGPELWRLIGAGLDAALKQQGVKPGTRLVWLPSGWLGMVPLGLAEDAASGQRLADSYEIVYVPSLEVLAPTRRDAGHADQVTLAAIINPTGDLPGTESEGALVASHFASGARIVLKGEAATSDAVLAALKGKTYWHFASHGTFTWADPRHSGLIMHGHQRLSVDRLLETEGLGHPRLVVLSACETGLFEITSNPDEFVGLPGAFLAIGVEGVVGTLWPVSDAATALLMAKFYELHMTARLSPPAALHQAQAWLREATADDLTTYAKGAAERGRIDSRQFAEIGQALSAEGLERSRNRAIVQWIGPRSSDGSGSASPASATPRARPYAHPYFWAGFIHTGL
jgi:CHAT domain-containing protein/tetratricopeptide (TPR) repeat protein